MCKGIGLPLLVLSLHSAALGDVEFEDFSDTSDLALLQAAVEVDGVLFVTPSATARIGAAWLNEPQRVASGFETALQFRIRDPGRHFGHGDGMAFVIQCEGTDALGHHLRFGGSGLGYAGLYNCLAVEFDTFGQGTPEIAIQTNGTGENTNHPAHTVGAPQRDSAITNGSTHAIRVVYEPPNLRVEMNGSERLSVRIGRLSVGDPVGILEYLFGSGAVVCEDAADADDDGSVGITDAIGILGYLFRGTLAPRPPFAECGEDPSDDALDCEGFSAC